VTLTPAAVQAVRKGEIQAQISGASFIGIDGEEWGCTQEPTLLLEGLLAWMRQSFGDTASLRYDSFENEVEWT